MKSIRSTLNLRAGSLAICLTSLCLMTAAPKVHAQGTLTPTAGPSPSFKTLQQIEPRTDVMRLPGDPTASRIISQPGSYYLTTNLVGMPMLNGISIRANNVTLDLNGFALIGVPGSLDGINATMPWHDLEIRTGNIEGWGGDGVDTASPVSEGRYFNVRSFRNGGNGFNLGTRSVVTECQAASNTLNGIQVASGILKNCTVVGNGYDTNGFPLGFHGIFVVGGAGSDVVQDCVADFNSADGYNIGMAFPGRGSIISGCTAKANLDDGIQVSSHCVVRGNNCLTNGVNGIHVDFFGTGNRIEDNHVSLHPTGYLCDFGSFANILLKNTSQGNGAAFIVPPGNHQAAIVFFPGVGFVGAGPWDNFVY